MSVSHYLLKVPHVLLFFAITTLFAGLSVLGTMLFKKYSHLRVHRTHSEVVGEVFSTVGGLYGLLLGFVVFLVWDSADQAQSNANREGSLARGLYRDIRYHPDTATMAPLRAVYLAYVRHVVYREYPLLESGQPLTKYDRRTFNDVFRQLERLDARDPLIEQMFRHLNELATYRGLRQLNATSEIPGILWLPLLAGALLTIVFVTLLKIDSLRLHLLVSGLLGAFLGMTIYIIVLLDHPFAGEIKIEPEEYRLILTMDEEGD
ncbi:MAG: DUF4239 domain-containing protein [Sphingobacteriaceae bacterium]|nr:DUF4239 domain-containing protein [Cytophagaceae bacterium]